MDNKKAKELISKYHQGTATEEERLLVEQWFLIDLEASNVVPDREVFARADRKIVAGLNEHVVFDKPVRNVRLWQRIAVVAAAVAAIVFGVWFFKYEIASQVLNDGRARDGGFVANDVAPGSYGATITLANGQVIQLDSAKKGVVVGGAAGANGLAYNDNTSVISNEERNLLDSKNKRSLGTRDDAVQLIAMTAKGQTYSFTLPDGTKVWLNADSKISFPSQFYGKVRKIILEGEGYFEVAKDQVHPFIVVTAAAGQHGSQEVKVLGTHFNINSYAEEKVVRTTLLEGSVEVSVPPPVAPLGIQPVPGISQILKPNQQAQFAAGRIRIAAVEGANEIAWKDGQFVFNSEPLESVMRKVARWYGVKVVYKDDLRDKKFSGIVSRFGRISVLLRMLETTGRIHFELKEKTIIINKVN